MLKSNFSQIGSTVFRDGNDPILIEDLNGTVIEMNREAERAYGWSREELIGRPIKTIVPPERHVQADELLVKCRAGEEVRNVEGLRVTKAGKTLPVLLTLSLLKDDNGEATGIATNASDISTLKLTQQNLAKMSKVFHDGNDPILIEDLNGTVIEMNREAERSYGWSREELIGRPIKTIVPPERHAQADELLVKCRAGEEVRNVEGLRVTKAGKTLPVLLTLSLLKDDNGEATGIATNASDISTLKLTQQELAEMNQTLEGLSSKLSKYLSPQVYKSIFIGEQNVALETKRKKLTIFFSDIKDFTATTDDLEPEDITFLVNDFLTEMSAIALRYGATIDKFIGDAMLIFFGDPTTEGVREDALTCVRMAIAMQRHMVELRAKWTEMGYARPFQMRVGINTGFCNVGNFGSEERMDYTIIGAEVNLAARLEGVADPDGITMSYETYALIKEFADAEMGEPITVKGIHRQINPYKLIGIYKNVDEANRYLRAENSGMKLFLDRDNLNEITRPQAIHELEEALIWLRGKEKY